MLADPTNLRFPNRLLSVRHHLTLKPRQLSRLYPFRLLLISLCLYISHLDLDLQIFIYDPDDLRQVDCHNVFLILGLHHIQLFTHDP